MKSAAVRPFLKWVGGKTHCLETLLASFPGEIHGSYHEPFLGGGSVLLAVLESQRVKGKVYASDVNEALIYTFKNIQRCPEEVLEHICAVPDEATYYALRSEFNSLDKKTPKASALFIVLNKTCFRGLYREGPHGMNVPYGHYKNPTLVTPDHIRAVSRLIANVTFSVASFETSLSLVRPGDFVYMDPPYFPVSSTSFVAYTTKDFHGEALMALCDKLPCPWVMSNSNVQCLRDKYDCVVVSCPRRIHSKDPSSKANELLIKSPSPTTRMSL